MCASGKNVLVQQKAHVKILNRITLSIEFPFQSSKSVNQKVQPSESLAADAIVDCGARWMILLKLQQHGMACTLFISENDKCVS